MKYAVIIQDDNGKDIWGPYDSITEAKEAVSAFIASDCTAEILPMSKPE